MFRSGTLMDSYRNTDVGIISTALICLYCVLKDIS